MMHKCRFIAMCMMKPPRKIQIRGEPTDDPEKDASNNAQNANITTLNTAVSKNDVAHAPMKGMMLKKRIRRKSSASGALRAKAPW